MKHITMVFYLAAFSDRPLDTHMFWDTFATYPELQITVAMLIIATFLMMKLFATLNNYDSCDNRIIYIDIMIPMGLHEAANQNPSDMHVISIVVGTWPTVQLTLALAPNVLVPCWRNVRFPFCTSGSAPQSDGIRKQLQCVQVLGLCVYLLFTNSDTIIYGIKRVRMIIKSTMFFLKIICICNTLSLYKIEYKLRF